MDPIWSHMCIDVSCDKHTYHVLYSRNEQSVTQCFHSISESILKQYQDDIFATLVNPKLLKNIQWPTSQLKFHPRPSGHKSNALLPWAVQSHDRNQYGWMNPAIWSYMWHKSFLWQTCVHEQRVYHLHAREQTNNHVKQCFNSISESSSGNDVIEMIFLGSKTNKSWPLEINLIQLQF